MKLSLLGLSLLGCLSTYAGTFTDLDLDSQVENRAELTIEKYDVASLNIDVELAKLVKSYNKHSESCGEARVGDGNSDFLKSYYSENQLSKTIRGLVKSGKIVGAFDVSDGDEGESEYCSTSTYKYFSNDGEVLTIDFDFNTLDCGRFTGVDVAKG